MDKQIITTTNKTIKAMETKVVCPKCGSEIAIQEHESLTVGVSIGKDSGLGTVTLKLAQSDNNNTNNKSNNKATMGVSKKIEAMKAAGIDVTNLFSVANSEGVERIAKIENGTMEFLEDDDPIMQKIMNGGSVPNRRLFRRWIMSQVFHMLSYKDYNDNPIGFITALQRKGYQYSWEMLIEELKVQAKLSMTDKENFEQRNRFFNKYIAIEMFNDYVGKLQDHIDRLTKRNKRCKGVPYITLKGKHIFVVDIYKKVFSVVENLYRDIYYAKNAQELYLAVYNTYHTFIKKTYCDYKLTMSNGFKDAYKGAGAYFTMRNLIMFHNCRLKDVNRLWLTEKASLSELDRLANKYHHEEGWRLFGIMKEMLDYNNIDIEKKMAEWRK